MKNKLLNSLIFQKYGISTQSLYQECNRENGSEQLQPELNIWEFTQKDIPNTGDWDRLKNYKMMDIQN